ncbi:MAG: hypothetical protein E6I22_00425 [Chloroflexi bacterium]|nr:MAG: hypothetical protein E6I22_00425 [Chloroflexota bacterium]
MAEPEHGGHGDFHLPPPSIWPAVLALGIAGVLTGLVINLVLLAVGALVTVAALAMWIKDARKEYRELPQQ